MAKLFKKNILLEKIQNFEIPNLEEKIKIIESWNNLYKTWKLHEKKETSIQWEFASHILWSILGYEDFVENNLEWNRQNEPWNPTWWQSADYWLWYFKSSKDFTKNIVKAVVEVKDTKTSLDKPQQRAWNLTPVQQAFKYKPYFSECDFIIVSNFYETRLYIDSYYDYEAWTLSDLVDPKDNYFNFRRFYYLLNKKNLITKKWESNTKSLLSYIRIQEKEITKRFYKEYTILRKELFKDIVANNPWFKKAELDFLLNKTQKIIDRIIFIHFCEDLDLLPDGKLKEVVDFWEKSLASTWQTLCNFFNAVDKWSDKLWIPDWYNWGLFHYDEELNNLKVWDEICKKFIDLWEYDFADDLSVNILGHIFEQSISDIEELKDKINRQEEAALSKRKKDWVFYTPEYIVDYIVKNSAWKKIDEWEDELKEKHNLKEDITDKNYNKRAILVYEELQEKLQNIKVLDPACWSGAFLVKVFDFLLDKNKEISKKLEDLWLNQGLFSSESYFRTILQNNIYWVDLNEESVEITKLSLWLKTAQKGKKLANLDSNIKCGNSLIDDPEVAWNKAFVWETEFKEIFDNGWFDVIVWNPPYIFARWNNFNELEKAYYYNKFKLQKYQINTYILFTELWYNFLKQDWILGYIIPNNWQTINTCVDFRKFIFENLWNIKVVNSYEKIFEDANVDSWVLIFSKKKTLNYEFLKYKEQIFSEIDSGINFKNNDYTINFKLFENKNNLLLVDKINKQSILLNSISEIKAWLQAYEVWKWIPKQTKEMRDNRIYHKNSKELDNDYLYLEWKDVWRYILWKPKQYLEYWKNLAAPRVFELFSEERILVRQIPSPFPKCINSVYLNDIILNDRNSMIIYKFSDNFSWKYINILLNSSLTSFWFVNTFDKLQRWLFPQFKVNELWIFPIKNISLSKQKLFIEKADFMLDKNKELQEKVNKFIKRLNSSFEIEKSSKKLENFYDLEFSEFVKELKKKKVELSLKDQDEWEEYFDSYKKEILELKHQIYACDKEIDEMVFDLYKLSKEEREIILENN